MSLGPGRILWINDQSDGIWMWIFKIHNVSDVRQIEIHTVELLLPGPSHLEVEILLQS
jgi:hypothetical protein